MSHLILNQKKRHDYMQMLQSHGRALAVELTDVSVRTDVIATHYHPVPRRGPLNKLLGRTRPGFTTVSGWDMGGDPSRPDQSLMLGTDGVIYIRLGAPASGREIVPLDEAHLPTLETAHAVWKRLHALEERTDIFNRLRTRAE